MKYLMIPPTLCMRPNAKAGDLAITIACDDSMVLLKRVVTANDAFWQPVPCAIEGLRKLCIDAWTYCHVEMIEGRMRIPTGVHPKLCHQYIAAWRRADGDVGGKVYVVPDEKDEVADVTA